MSQRLKGKATKTDRESFFLARTAETKARNGHGPSKDGAARETREGSVSPPASPSSAAEEGPLMISTMRLMLAELTENLQTSMKTQLQALAADLRKDITELIVDRAHMLRRPKHLPPTTERDVIARVHFYHTKEQLMKASRSSDMPDPYSRIKLFADLSAATLQFRKNLTPVTSTLRDHNIAYRWGYPAKLLIHHRDALHAIPTLELGITKLKSWGLQTPEAHQHHPSKVPRLSPEWTVN
ncbi:Hypothetical predicted protein [Pelobates cultripes]|uniref:Uncharacterized protein n=1 Tax=Pelobates cultripes TaxID=61616 RepID=A0AAD1SU53_PELCU|nr:Hypothetical predicted protein [Pelobates cultripes]